jgi:hypothetical protein
MALFFTVKLFIVELTSVAFKTYTEQDSERLGVHAIMEDRDAEGNSYLSL